MQPIAAMPPQSSPTPARVPAADPRASAHEPDTHEPDAADPRASAHEPDTHEPDAAELREAVAATRAVVRTLANNIEFSVDHGTGKTLIRVIDSHTGEVIRQIPGEEMLAIARTLDRLQGLIFHRTA